MPVLQSIKDKLLQAVLRSFFNFQFKHYGRMTNLTIDSKNRTFQIELDLKGETSPIKISINQYEFAEEGGETFICLGKIEASREWVTVLANELLDPATRIPLQGPLKILKILL